MATGGGAGTSAGGGSAYVRLQRPDEGLSQTMQYWGGLQARENEAARQAKERADAVKAKQEEEDLKRYSIDPKDFTVADAGFSDLNADNINYANDRVNESADLMRQAQEAVVKGDRAGAEIIRNKAIAIQSSFASRMKTMDTAKKTFEGIQKLGLEGKLSGYNKGVENFYKATTMGGTVRTIRNDKGEDVTVATYTDKDGTHRQIISSTDINSGAFGPFLKQDIDGDIRKIAGSLKGIERKNFGGGVITTTLTFDPTVEKSARQALQPMLNSPSYMADIIDQRDLYEKLGIDKNNPPAVPKFTDKQRKIVEDAMIEEIKGQFRGKDFRERDYRAEELELRKQQLNKPKAPTKADEKRDMLSKLYYDAKQATEHGDYSILLGNYTDPSTKDSYTITKVVESPDGRYLIPVTSTGEKLEPIVKTEEAILSAKINGNPTAYKGITVPEVQSHTPLKYRSTNVKASDITALTDELYDEQGNRKKGKNEESILKELNKVGVTGEDVWDFSLSGGDIIKINGVEIDTSNKASFTKGLQKALAKPEPAKATTKNKQAAYKMTQGEGGAMHRTTTPTTGTVQGGGIR